MKIAIDARPFSGPTNGFTVYLTSILETLVPAGHEITLIADAPLPELALFKGCAQVILPASGKVDRYLWAQRTLLRHLRHSSYDVYFVGSNTGLPVLYFGKTKLLLGLLDIIPLRFPMAYLARRPDITLVKYLIPQFSAILKARQIITISEASRRDIKKLFPWKKVTMSHIKLDTTYVVKQPAKIQPQFVYVGGVDARKKIDTIIRALALFNKTSEVPYNLQLIGRGYNVYDELINELGLANLVIMPGYLSEERKMQVIAESTAMVYLSLYEGYGLAITEAYLNNVPIICGPGGSQKEIAGDGALYVDPKDPQEVAEAMREILKPDVRERLKQGAEIQLKALISSSIDQNVLNFFKEAAK